MINIKEVKNKDIYIMDVSYYLYRGIYALKYMGINEGVNFIPTGHLVSILSTITSIKDMNKDAIIFLAVDGFNMDNILLLESVGVEYKGGRDKLEYNPRQDVDKLLELAYQIPDVYGLFNDDAEADEIAYALAKSLDKSNKVFLCSSDNDWLQGLDENIYIFKGWTCDTPCIVDITTYKTDEKYTKKFHGVSPTKLAYYRALTGDSSDNIKGIYRMPKKLAKSIAEHTNSIKMFKEATLNYSSLVKPTQVKYLKSMEEEYKRLEINYRVMKLKEETSFEIEREVKPVKELALKLELGQYMNWLKNHSINLI